MATASQRAININTARSRTSLGPEAQGVTQTALMKTASPQEINTSTVRRQKDRADLAIEDQDLYAWSS